MTRAVSRRRVHEVGDQRVHRIDRVGPGPADVANDGALRQPALLADDAADAGQLFGHSLVHGDDVVERVSQLAVDAGKVVGESVREIARPQRDQAVEQLADDGGFKRRLRVHRAHSSLPPRAGEARSGGLFVGYDKSDDSTQRDGDVSSAAMSWYSTGNLLTSCSSGKSVTSRAVGGAPCTKFLHDGIRPLQPGLHGGRPRTVCRRPPILTV